MSRHSGERDTKLSMHSQFHYILIYNKNKHKVTDYEMFEKNYTPLANPCTWVPSLMRKMNV